jgi:xanthine dehydrogenase small subunit
MIIRFTLNDTPIVIDTAPDRRLVDLLREDLGARGTKEGCGSGECGSCTILVDGEPRLSCLMLAAQAEGRAIRTIEGVGTADQPHPVQTAFAEHGAVQCGFCTPGMVLTAIALLARREKPDRQEIRAALAGHLCRCTGYHKIVDAVEAASRSDVGTRKDGAAATGGWNGGAGPQDDGRIRRMSVSEVLFPRGFADLWALLARHPDAHLVAGGTDLLVRRRTGWQAAAPLICLERLEELQTIGLEGASLRIGAGVSLRACLEHPDLRRHVPVLAAAIDTLGAPQIRTMGTLGGNICTASPAGDTLPPLYALEAEVILRSPDGGRSLPLAAFIQGPGRTDLRPGEILEQVRIPVTGDFPVQHFEKVGQRNSLAISVVSLAAILRTAPDGTVAEARLALGSVGPTVIRPGEAERFLVGRRPDRATLREAAGLVRAAVRPIDDVRATAAYRRECAGNLLLRLAID